MTAPVRTRRKGSLTQRPDAASPDDVTAAAATPDADNPVAENQVVDNQVADIRVIDGGPVPVPAVHPRAVLALAGAVAAQFVVFLVVDTWAVLLRRRSLATSAGCRMRAALVRRGPVYAKLARLMGSHAAVIPGPMLAGFDAGAEPSLRRLPTTVVREIVDRELGGTHTRFATFDDEPARVTTLAQSHAATLIDGTPVTVKVRRPGLAEREADQGLAMVLIAALARRFLPKGVSFDRATFVAQLAKAHHDELDLRVEAAHLRRVAGALDARSAKGLVVPRPVPGMATAQVLVTERLTGTPLHRIDDRAEVARLLGCAADAVLWGAARAGIFPADLSPAFLLALPDGRLGVTDYNDCCQLDEDERVGLSRLLDATARHDERAQLHALDLMHAIKPDVDRRALLARLAWARTVKGDLWSVDPLHDVPHLFLLLADSGIEVTVPLLRLAENLLHLEATARALGAGLELGPRLEATCRLGGRRRQDPYGPPLTGDELAAAGTASDAGELRKPPSLRDLTRMVPEAMKPNRKNIGNFAPIMAFLPLNATLGLSWGIGGSTLVALAFALHNRLRGQETSRAAWIGLAFIILPGLVGVVFESKVAFFGPQLAFPFIINIVALGSVLVGRPLLAVVAQAVWPQPASVRRDRGLARTFTVLTLVWATFHTVAFVAEVWLLVGSSANTFVVVHTIVQQLSFPLTVAVLWLLKRAVSRAPEIEQRILASAALAA